MITMKKRMCYPSDSTREDSGLEAIGPGPHDNGFIVLEGNIGGIGDHARFRILVSRETKRPAVNEGSLRTPTSNSAFRRQISLSSVRSELRKKRNRT